MSKHTCQAIAVTCIDFRLQQSIEGFLNERFGPKNYDRVALAGGVKDLESVMRQIELSKHLHDVSKIILVNHEDCGAYGAEGTKEAHEKDLKRAKTHVLSKFKDVDVEIYYLHLNPFEKINSKGQ